MLIRSTLKHGWDMYPRRQIIPVRESTLARWEGNTRLKVGNRLLCERFALQEWQAKTGLKPGAFPLCRFDFPFLPYHVFVELLTSLGSPRREATQDRFSCTLYSHLLIMQASFIGSLHFSMMNVIIFHPDPSRKLSFVNFDRALMPTKLQSKVAGCGRRRGREPICKADLLAHGEYWHEPSGLYKWPIVIITKLTY